MFLVLEHVPSANSAKAGDGTGSRPVTPLGRRACRADVTAGEWVQVCARVPVVRPKICELFSLVPAAASGPTEANPATHL